MRLIVSLIATAAMFLGASMASALELTVIGGIPTEPVAPGDIITLDIRMSNTNGDTPSVLGLGASVHGYAGNASFVSGEAVGTYLNTNCFPGFGCFGGLPNLAGAASGANRTLAQSSIGAFGPRVQIALSASTTATTGIGTIDPGLDGGNGTAQFRVSFQILEGAQDFDLLIDSSYQGDLVNTSAGDREIAGQTVRISIVPEPGTALLMGLGLAGLAAAGRRE